MLLNCYTRHEGTASSPNVDGLSGVALLNATNMLLPSTFLAPTIAKSLTAVIPSRLGFPGIADTAIHHRQAFSSRIVVLGRSKMTNRHLFFDNHLLVDVIPWSPCPALPLPH